MSERNAQRSKTGYRVDRVFHRYRGPNRSPPKTAVAMKVVDVRVHLVPDSPTSGTPESRVAN